jgi:hypothetical protein
MKTPQHLNPFDAFGKLAQNWHPLRRATSDSGEFLSVWAARIGALWTRQANPAGRDQSGGDLPDAEFMARFAQELARWPCLPTEFSLTPASRQRYAPEWMNSAEVQEMDIAGACRPPEDLLDGYFQWLAPAFGDVAFVMGEGTDTSDPDLGVSSLIRHYFRITSGGELLKPKRIAFDLNNLISDSRDSQSSVTCFYAHYTGSTRILRYFNAGHRSPLLLRSHPNQVIRLNKGGPPFGSSQGQSYSEGTVQLKAGDRILAFNRGVAESWATPNDDSAEMALLNVMRGWKHETAAEIANLIVADGPGAARHDSIAIVGWVSGALSRAHDICMDQARLGAATL